MTKKPPKNKLQDVTNEKVYEANHIAIREAFLNLYQEKKHSPTQAEIAKRCNLSRKCVNEHLRELKIEDVTPAMKAKTLEVLDGLFKKAKKGNASEVKLWMQLVHGWKESTTNMTFEGKIDYSSCSLEQLTRLRMGENPLEVLRPDQIK